MSYDAKHVFSCSDDNTIIMWSTASGEEQYRRNVSGPLRAVAVTRDNNRLVTVSANSISKKFSVVIWDIPSMELIHEIDVKRGEPIFVFIAVNARYIVFPLKNHMIWDIDKKCKTSIPKMVPTQDIHRDMISVAVGPDGRRVIISADRVMKEWDDVKIDNWNPIQIVRDYLKETRNSILENDLIALLFGETQGVHGIGDTKLTVWDAYKKSRYTLDAHKKPITCLAVDYKCANVFSGSMDCTVNKWSLFEGMQHQTLEGHSGPISDIAIAKNGTMVTGSWDKSCRVWDLNITRDARTVESHRGRVTSIVFAMDGKYTISASADSNIIVWDSFTGDKITTFDKHFRAVNKISVFPDKFRLLSVSEDYTSIIWDLKALKPLIMIQPNQCWLWDMAISKDSRKIVFNSDPFTGGKNQILKIYSLDKHDSVSELIGHYGVIYAVRSFNKSNKIITASADANVIVWDLDKIEMQYVLKGHTKEVFDVAIDNHDMLAATASLDDTVRIWDLRRGKLITTLIRCVKKDSAPITTYYTKDLSILTDNWPGRNFLYKGYAEGGETLSFSIDGSKIASASKTKIIDVWNIESGKHVELHGHDGLIRQIGFFSDNRTLISVSCDCTIRFWDTESGEQIRKFAGESPIWSFQLSPQEELVIVGDDEGKVYFLSWR